MTKILWEKVNIFNLNAKKCNIFEKIKINLD